MTTENKFFIDTVDYKQYQLFCEKTPSVFMPQEAEGPSKEAAPAKGEPGRKAETCTTNTDKVDREIEKLKEERDQLEQQIRTTKDPDKAEDLKRQLAQLENELRQKDNDAYRRQNAVIS